MGAKAPHAQPTDAEPLLAALLDRLLDADQRGASMVVERALTLDWTIDDVRFSLITPAMWDIGVRWERGQIGVADEHLASSVCEWLLFGLAGRARRSAPTGRRAVVGCSDGELHVLGARMIAHILVEHGWRVLYVGAATPAAAWSQIVRARRPEAAVVCTSTQPRLEQVGPALQAIKAASPHCRTVVGGQAYWDLPEPPAGVQADLVALEARTFARQLA